MYVAQVIDTLRVGGAQSLLATLVETLPRDSVCMDLIVLAAGPEMVAPVLRERLERAGTEIVTVPGNNLLDPQRVRRLRALLRERNYDVVHTHLTYANILGTSTARVTGRPVIGTVHNVKPSHQGQLHLMLEGKALQWMAQHVLAVGERVAAAARQRWPGIKVEVVPNAIALPAGPEPGRRVRLRQALAGNADTLLLLAVGRLTDQKGYPDLLEAIAQLSAAETSAMLLIAGTGEARPALERKIIELGLEEKVRLLGIRDDIPALLGAVDLFVSASRWEGMPVALLEAMGAGLPVVATAVGDVTEVVTEATGVLVPAEQPNELAAAMSRLLADRSRREAMGRAARERVRHHYGAEVWAERLLALYEEVSVAR